MKTAEIERQEFIEKFNELHGDKIISMELAELRASTAVFPLLNLKTNTDENSIWGLVCFCENQVYFHSFPQDNYISLYMRKTTGEKDPVAQCISLSKLKCVYNIHNKNFFDFIFPGRRHVVKVCFWDQDKISHFFELVFTKNADDLIKKFK